MPADPPRFGDLLRRHRRDRQLTQEALAERAHISARAVSDLERGERRHPYRETAQVLADALHLSASERHAFLASAQRDPRSRTAEVAGEVTVRLPHPLTPLIGRDQEVSELTRAIRDEQRRLVTLTGPAGVGKTRLAVEVATTLATSFADGAVFVDLAPRTDAEQLPGAIATALGATVPGTVSLLEAARRALASRQLVLVLDNFEHLLTAAPMVSDFLEAAPGVTALVTSRAALRLRGEREIVLSPLPTPAVDSWHSLDELAHWDAIRLFVARAQDGHPGFTLTEDNASAVAAICQRVDGLPLAIELAASRIRTMAPEALLARLETRLPLLTRGARDAPARHQTLQTAIAWSYDLLTSDEQALFRSLAVFSGGWTLEAAEDVGHASGLADPLDALSTLCDHHLVVRDDAGHAPRYRMLETLHEYALNSLAAAGDEVRARQLHVRYLEHLARDNSLEVLDAEVEQRAQRLRGEAANLISGISWAIAHDPDAALRILVDLGPYWMVSDLAVEGRALQLRSLETSVALASPLRPRLLALVAWLQTYLGAFAAAEPLAHAAFALAQERGDDWVIAHVRCTQGGIAMSQGDPGRARAVLEESLMRFTALDDAWGTYVTLTELAIAAMDSGEYDAALGYLDRLGDLVDEHGLIGIYRAYLLINLADIYRLIGAFGEVEALCNEVLTMPSLMKPAMIAVA